MAANLTTLSISNALGRTAEGVAGGAFPLEVFPQKVQELILNLKKTYGHKVEYVASAMLVAAATAIGNSRHLRIRGNFTVAPLFYMVIVGYPGLGKSAPLDFAFKPIKEIDKQAFKDFKEAWKAFKEQKASVEQTAHDAEPLDPPKRIQTILNDFTQEAMMAIHAVNERGVCCVYDELIGLFKTVSRYSASSLIESLLTMYSGQSIISSRKNEDLSAIVERPCMSIIGTIQAAVLPKLAKMELEENGMFDRFMFVIPDDTRMVRRKDLMTSPGYDCEAVWKGIIDRLFELQMELDPVSDEPSPIIWELSKSAAEHYVEWYDSFVEVQNQIEDASLRNTRMAKWEYTVPRLALVLQLLSWACFEDAGVCVSLEAMKGAIRLNAFYEDCSSQVRQILIDEQTKETKVNGYESAKETWFKILPADFETAFAVKIGQGLGLSKDTVNRLLKKHLENGYIEKNGHGKYHKSDNSKTD